MLKCRPPPHPSGGALGALHGHGVYTIVAKVAAKELVSFKFESSLGVKTYVTPTTYSAVTQGLRSFRQGPSSCSTVFANSLNVMKRAVLFSLLARGKFSVSSIRRSYNVLVCSPRARSARSNNDKYKYTTSILTNCVLPNVVRGG